ncbi:MAG: signal peptide peptidase SppA [Bradymonadia bacterium]
MTNPHQPPPAQPPRRGWGCLLLALTPAVMLVLMALWLFQGTDEGVGAMQVVVESAPEGVSRTVVIVDAKGVMMGGRRRQPGALSGDLHRVLDAIEDDDTVVGLLLRLDTPGGSVTDADVLHHRLTDLKAGGTKVLVHMGDLCASGGVYLAAAADEIWALPTTVTGSIGVIINTLNVSALMERVGVADTSVTSGPHKQLLSPTRPPSEADRAILKNIVDEMYTRFVQVVADGRKWEGEAGLARVRALADGRLYSAQQAVDAGLVDAVGYSEAAQARLEAMVGGPVRVVRYSVRRGLFEMLAGHLDGAPFEGLEAALQGPRALYMVGPGLRW